MPYSKEKRKFKIFTLGCKVNQWESAYFRTALEDAGWEEAGEGEAYDVAIINTCIVTQRASHQSRQALRKFIRDNPNALVVATGCYAQAYPDELIKIEGLGAVVGNTLKPSLPSLLTREGEGRVLGCLVEQFEGRSPLVPVEAFKFGERTRAYLKIQDGCEAHCSYCIVPKARGPYRSLEVGHVLRMLAGLAEKGFREVVLTGIHLGKYGVDLHPQVGLVELLRSIKRERLPIRIRLSSIEPGEIEDDLIEMVAGEPWLCRHLHIPLQSGDPAILKAMARTYSPAQFRALMVKIRDHIPLAALGVDVMVGFPGETEEAFRHTYDLIKDLPISYLHVFPFSPRRDTPAARLAHRVPPEEVKRRASMLRELGRYKRKEFWQACIGKEFETLVEGRPHGKGGMVRGITDNYISVCFPRPDARPGDLVRLTLKHDHVGWQNGDRCFHP